MVYNMADQDTTPETGRDSSSANNGGRRRFLGAGTAAAPFVLTLVSQPALGVTCFTPSRSMSRNTSLSQQGKFGECTDAESPGNYKTQKVQGGNAYRWPSSVLPTAPFHPTFFQGSIAGETSFTSGSNNTGTSKTLAEVLSINVSGNVAKHIIAAYLNKLGGNGAVIPDSAITLAGIKNMWAEYATKGFYEPMAGIKWYAQDIVNYLISNGIVK